MNRISIALFWLLGLSGFGGLGLYIYAYAVVVFTNAATRLPH